MSDLDHSSASQAADKMRWVRVEELFHAAQEMQNGQRAADLDARCANDPKIKAEVLELLDSDALVIELVAEPLRQTGHHLVRAAEAEDRWIGRTLDGFKIEALLGRGGMGVVYSGSRVRGILSQRVAIKLMARPLESTPALQQFLLERETLASLEHPHIAKLVGGGVTEEHLPFVAMEYVDGKRLDGAADDPSTSMRQIAWWIIQLCEAVSCVHRNLILHRDIKPGNVMVTKEGVVKLLDFGTLKGIGSMNSARSEMTQVGMRPVTLRYASPEYIRGELGATTLDVYSLGMTLYRSLAGQLPSVDASSMATYIDGLALLEPQLIALMSPKRLDEDPELAADLDAIVRRAIRPRADDRYLTADALEMDPRRALNKMPVNARTGTLRYRADRFVRRNRLLVIGSSMAAMRLLIGLFLMVSEIRIARAESARADKGIEQERGLAHLLLFDYFERVKRIPGSTDAQRHAVMQALQYLDNLNSASPSPALQLDTIKGYTEMGLLQGSQNEENLGDSVGAVATLTKAVASAHDLASRDPKNLSYLLSQAAAERALGQVYFGTAEKTKAIEHFTIAGDVSQRISSFSGVISATLVQAASTVDSLGDTLGLPGVGTMNDPAKAIVRYRQAAEVYRTAFKLDPGCMNCARGIVVEDYMLGTVTGDKEQAVAFDHDGLAVIATLPKSAS